MGLNAAGITALMDQGNEAVIWLAMGDGETAGDQTSNERVQLVLGTPAGAVSNAAGTPYAFTGAPGAGASHGLFFSASSGGVFYGFKQVGAGSDVTFNAAGEYSINSATLTGTSPV